MTDLKPCPFCGGEPRIVHFTQDACYVLCENIDCMAMQKVYGTKSEAIAAWNARAERTCRNIRNWSNHEFECSSCGYELYPEDGTYESDGTLRFCPNCGAKVVDA